MLEKHPWRDNQYTAEVADLKGMTFDKVYMTDDKTEIIFENDEYIFTFYHEQDCCESVYVEDIAGDLSDLEGSPILFAEESTTSNNEITSDYSVDRNWNDESNTWTFYKFATRKGWVDVRWYGSSNGYYSERVYLKVEKKR